MIIKEFKTRSEMMVIIFEIKENLNTSFRHLYSPLYPLRIFMTRGEWIRLQQRFLWLSLSPLIFIFNQSQYKKLYISLKKTPTDLRNFNKTYLFPFKFLYWILVSYLFMNGDFYICLADIRRGVEMVYNIIARIFWLISGLMLEKLVFIGVYQYLNLSFLHLILDF